jgi:hypothetical protein
MVVVVIVTAVRAAPAAFEQILEEAHRGLLVHT